MLNLIDLLILSLLYWCGGPVDACKWYLVVDKKALEIHTDEERTTQGLRTIFPILL